MIFVMFILSGLHLSIAAEPTLHVTYLSDENDTTHAHISIPVFD